jgi:monoamine oxidase
MKEVGREIERYGWQLTGSEVGPLKFLWQFGNEDKDAFPIASEDRYAFERALFQIGFDARRIDTTRPRDEQDLADLDISVADYLKRLNLPQRVYDVIAAYARIGSGAAVEDWSALMALSLVAAYDNSPYAWFASVTTRFRDGTAEPVATLAAAADTVRLNSIVTSIEQTPSKIAVTLESGERFTASVGVLAVPVTLWSTISFSPPLNEAKRYAAVRGHAGRMGKIWIMVDNLDEDISSFGGDTDLLLLQTEYRLPGRSILVGFASPPNQIDISDHEAVVRAVHQHVPSANVVASFAHDWNTDPFARGAWAATPVGQLSHHATGVRSPEGRLTFAGSDIAMRWMGWIDGAIETGRLAAAEADAIAAAT